MSKKRKKKNGGLSLVIFILVIAAIGTGVYFAKNGKMTTPTSAENSKQGGEVSSDITSSEDKKDEEVTYLAYPDLSEEERQVLERYSNNNDYKVIPVSGSKFKGYLVAIYEPQRIHAVITGKRGSDGEYVDKMVSDNNAILGINAGGFLDPDFNGDGEEPLGLTISKNKMLVTDKYPDKRGGVVGFDTNNKLVLEALDSSTVASRGIRDCISFGPYLIVNGTAKEMTGTGAFGPKGRSARSVIGQREDGIVLLLCVDGDRTKGEGATLPEVIDIMKKYGAVNASNLDGGTSCQLVVDGKMINDPTSLNGEHRSRPVASAFVLEKDGQNNGDNSAIK